MKVGAEKKSIVGECCDRELCAVESAIFAPRLNVNNRLLRWKKSPEFETELQFGDKGVGGVTLECVFVVLGAAEHSAHQAAGFFLVARDHSQPAIAPWLGAAVVRPLLLHAKGAAAHAPRPTFAAPIEL